MAVNQISVTEGSGKNVATDTIGTVDYGIVKVADGRAGSTSVMAVNPSMAALVATGAATVVTMDAQALLARNARDGLSDNPTSQANFLFNGTTWDAWRGTIGEGALVNIGSASIIVAGQTSIAAVVIAALENAEDGVSQAALYADGGDAPNPIGTANFVFNGTSWDRLRGTVNNGALVQTGNASVITTWQAPSIVGSYAEDAAHATGDKGIFTLGVRNDTLASVTSATGDYSQFAVGPSGEQITANAPITRWIRGTADMRGVGALGGSVTVIAAQGASVFSYLTSAQFVNIGGASVLVTISGGLGSTLGYTIAPAGGGSNIYYPNALKTGENSALTASISGVASILVSYQGFTAGI